MSDIWFSSDQHYFHKNILKFTKRPFSSIEEMNENMVEWNNKNVKDNDEVWNLGDFSFGDIDQTISILERLKGRQHLILGNHCKLIKKNRTIFSKYFSSIQDMRELHHNKTKIILCHYPLRSWDSSNYGSLHLHGHLHGAMAPYGRSVDVGIDSEFITGKFEGRPFHIDEVKDFLLKREIVKDYGD